MFQHKSKSNCNFHFQVNKFKISSPIILVTAPSPGFSFSNFVLHSYKIYMATLEIPITVCRALIFFTFSMIFIFILFYFFAIQANGKSFYSYLGIFRCWIIWFFFKLRYLKTLREKKVKCNVNLKIVLNFNIILQDYFFLLDFPKYPLRYLFAFKIFLFTLNINFFLLRMNTSNT